MWAGLVPATDPAQPPAPCAPAPAGFRVERRVDLPGRDRAPAQCADVLRRRNTAGTRRLRVFDGAALAFALDGAPKCVTCGGTMGDPLTGVAWDGGALVVSHEGGSREAWREDWTFTRRAGRWVLAGWTRDVTDRLTGQGWSERVNTLTGRATVRYAPPEDGCAALQEARPGARCDASAPFERRCAFLGGAPPPAAALALDERPWACGLERP